ncbi:Calpain-like cysteine peptidase [Chamberlinius hualienensis]
MGENDNYESLRDRLVASGELYEDDSFPPTESSLGFGKDDFQWMRPQEICELNDPSLPPQLIVDGRSRSDVRQGKYIENCWVVAAAACFTTASQETFDKVVPPAQSFDPGEYCGAFHFNFWNFGEWVNVIVDDRLPTLDGKLAFTHSLSPNEFWGALLEKAYAKLNGSYRNLEFGHAADALTDFTGGVVEQFVFELDDNVYESVCSSLKKVFHANSMATLATPSQDKKTVLKNGLITNHAYSVIGIEDIGLESIDVVACRLVNPWGEGTVWHCDCVDGDEGEKDKALNELNSQILATGEFWMDVNDVISNFYRLELCYIVENSSLKFQEILFGSWIFGENAGGDRYDVNFETNPQLIVNFKPSEAADVSSILIVELTQVDRRKDQLANLGINMSSFDISTTETPLTSGFLTDAEPLTSATEQEIMAADNRCVVRRYTDLSSDCNLAFICHTSKPDDEGKFMVRLLSNAPFSIINSHHFGVSWK